MLAEEAEEAEVLAYGVSAVLIPNSASTLKAGGGGEGGARGGGRLCLNVVECEEIKGDLKSFNG